MATQLNDWLSIDKISGTGNAEITLTASSYGELVDRVASLKIQAQSTNAILNVRQTALVPSATLDSYEIRAYKANTYTNGITSNVPWTAVVNDNWITINKTQGGSGYTPLYIVVDIPTETRRGSIVFNAEGVVLTLQIYQIYDLKEGYFWVEFEEANGTISGLTNDYTDMYHSFDGVTWEATPNTLSMGDNTLVYFKNNSKKISDDSLYLNINFNSNAKVGGDLSSITDMADYACQHLFYDNRHLTDASNLVLPWETIGKLSFDSMFAICTILKYPPIIKATKLGAGSCFQMFFNCYLLLRTPILLTPSNNFIPRSAYSRMFEGCSSLIEACDLNALKVGDAGYYQMFYGCTSLETAPNINAEHLLYTTVPSGLPNYRGKHMYCMFTGCKRLINVQSVLKANLTEECYKWMYKECSRLKIAPSLPQNTLPTDCYYGMFYKCTSLIYVKMLGSGDYEFKYGAGGFPIGTPISWFLNDVKTKGGTFVKHPDSKLTTNAPDGGGIPKDWTVETATE